MIFKCKRSGNTVSFTSSQDIESMRKNESYEVVESVQTQVTEIPLVQPPKKLGRPKKK